MKRSTKRTARPPAVALPPGQSSGMLSFLLAPKSLAVIGASDDTTKPGGKVTQNILSEKYRGEFFPVNPKRESIQGVRCWPSIQSLPLAPELALVAVPAPFVRQAVEELAAKGTRVVVVLSAGFGEVSAEGRLEEQRLAEIATAHGILLLGPNCSGVMSHVHASKFSGFMPKMVKGGIDFISGSGATIDFLVEQAVKRGLSFGSFLTVGNSAQTGVTDLLTLFAQDRGGADSPVKLLYLEKLAKPREFLESARSLVNRGCTLAGIKAGTTQAGTRAAASHTGAMVTNDTAVQALFDKAGIIRVQSRLELIDVACVLLAAKGRLDGRRVCIVTDAGGPGVMLADELTRQGLEIPALRASTQARLAQVLPPGAGLGNPVDCLPSRTGEMIGKVFEILTTEEAANLDYIAFITGNSGLSDNWEILKVVSEAMDSCPIPVLPSLCAAIGSRQALGKFRRAGKFHFEDEVALGRALGRVVNRPQPGEPVTGLPGYDQARIAACLHDQRGILPAGTTRQVLEATGLRFPGQVETSRKGDLESLPFPFPWAMKVMGPLHKTDLGGVRLGIQSLEEARAAWDELMGIQGAAGCLLQPMVSGSEVLIGANREADFGHLVAFGLGGVYTETLKDVSFTLAPLSREEAGRMIRSLRAIKLLEGMRGQPGMDLDLLADWLLRIGLLVADFPVIKELDLNPVKGLGRQLFVVDARIILE